MTDYDPKREAEMDARSLGEYWARRMAGDEPLTEDEVFEAVADGWTGAVTPPDNPEPASEEEAPW